MIIKNLFLPTFWVGFFSASSYCSKKPVLFAMDAGVALPLWTGGADSPNLFFRSLYFPGVGVTFFPFFFFFL